MINLNSNRPSQIDYFLDLKGLNCPLPILKTKAQLNTMAEGEVVHIVTTDPMAVLDFKSWAVRAPHVLIYLDELEDTAEFYIRKQSA